MTFEPTTLGEALVSAYCSMGLQNLWLPNLRGNIERNITAVAQGRRPKVRRSTDRQTDRQTDSPDGARPLERVADVQCGASMRCGGRLPEFVTCSWLVGVESGLQALCFTWLSVCSAGCGARGGCDGLQGRLRGGAGPAACHGDGGLSVRYSAYHVVPACPTWCGGGELTRLDEQRITVSEAWFCHCN
jgi:hypothetical protein